MLKNQMDYVKLTEIVKTFRNISQEDVTDQYNEVILNTTNKRKGDIICIQNEKMMMC